MIPTKKKKKAHGRSREAPSSSLQSGVVPGALGISHSGAAARNPPTAPPREISSCVCQSLISPCAPKPDGDGGVSGGRCVCGGAVEHFFAHLFCQTIAKPGRESLAQTKAAK